MASEIRVNKIENRSGLGTVTFADTGVDLAGIVTATTFSGSGASLTNVPDSALSAVTASKLSGALPAISAASLTNVPAANVVGVHTSLTVTNATTTGTAVVGGGVTISESGIEASGIGITVANINGSQIGGRRNLIINGAMNVAQRGTSSTSLYYQTVDRFRTSFGNLGSINLTQSQQQLTSSDTPYSSGFRYFYRAALSGAGSVNTNGYIGISQRLEAGDVAQSGWNYTSASSDITIQFWFRCSTNQTFYMALTSQDGTSQSYVFAFTASGNNTWTKIIKTIPGAANVQFDTDTVANAADRGLTVSFTPWYGTDYTGSKTVNAWSAYSGSAEYPDYASTWLTAGASTFDITGVQLEVGSQATAFEHRSYGEEESLCQRYYAKTYSGHEAGYFGVPGASSGTSYGIATFPVTMRSNPTVVLIDGTGATGQATQHGNNYFTATASGITKGGFTFVSRPSGNWSSNAQNPISAGYTADAEI